jgi:cytochrome c oxidase subunit 2
MRIRLFTVQPDEFESWARHQATLGAPFRTDTAAVDGFVFPKEQLPVHVVPQTPLPAGLEFDDALLAQGDAARGQQLFINCIACHSVAGNGMPVPPLALGPNLTHVASRHTIAGGLFANEPAVLARWIKNAKKMKPGATMNVFGLGEYDPILKRPVSQGGLTDQQIADLVAYLRTLK